VLVPMLPVEPKMVIFCIIAAVKSESVNGER
jgi:hypothetical protein